MKALKRLLETLEVFDYGLDKVTLLQRLISKELDINLDQIREEIIAALNNKNFDWVNIALEANFVHDPDDLLSDEITNDNLLIFTGAFAWKEFTNKDAWLSNWEKEYLKELLRDTHVNKYINITSLIESEDFEWLPFEVKNIYKRNFLKIQYRNEDIIYYLKKAIWEYLFPNSLDSHRLISLSEDCQKRLSLETINQGWIEPQTLVEKFLTEYPGLDLYEISKVNWGKKIQVIPHYRNILTMGFIRYFSE